MGVCIPGPNPTNMNGIELGLQSQQENERLDFGQRAFGIIHKKNKERNKLNRFPPFVSLLPNTSPNKGLTGWPTNLIYGQERKYLRNCTYAQEYISVSGERL